MHYVYILKSCDTPDQTYIGYSSNLKARLKTHNSGGCPHTSKFKPWELMWYCAFPDKYNSLAFESYLKSHSGKTFTSKRLINRSKGI